jgi:hypothetical protein
VRLGAGRGGTQRCREHAEGAEGRFLIAKIAKVASGDALDWPRETKSDEVDSVKEIWIWPKTAS